MQALELSITKISITKGGIGKIKGVKTDEQFHGEEFTSNCNWVAHPEFKDALSVFAIDVLRSMYRYIEVEGINDPDYLENEAIAQELSRVRVTSVDLGGDGAWQGVVIEFSLKGYDGNVGSGKTGRLRFGESSSYPFHEDIKRRWESLLEEAEAYYLRSKIDTENDPSGQTEMFTNEDEQPPENNNGLVEETESLLID